jgi:very-short-patch-repair endonuclease
MESFGERVVSRILERRRVRFVTQHKFADCIDKRPLRFDFWLPQKNALIEYDGPQHFEARDYYGGREHFTATQRRDRIKTAYARKKKIRLIRVKYSVRDVEAFLVKKLGLSVP